MGGFPVFLKKRNKRKMGGFPVFWKNGEWVVFRGFRYVKHYAIKSKFNLLFITNQANTNQLEL